MKRPKTNRSIYLAHGSMRIDDLMGLTEDMKHFLRRRNYARPTSNDDEDWWSDNPLDSRTIQWFDFMNWLSHSQLADETAVLSVRRSWPRRASQGVPTGAVRKRFAVQDIVLSRMCIEVADATRETLLCKMRPVKSAIPFLVRLFTHPGRNKDEARYPVESYVMTLSIHFFNLTVDLEMYREK